ncbi:hypothetical protein GPS63_10935 [Acinetobacter haemolyticus]|uniref:SCP2 domain-containing protein n=1 Tax=Acinetobacter haemolyticus TaxID=29430 RepID=A0AAJ2YRT8_ACIHA|nr:hypothetical protein [Acinetobacter haemolyticus]NAR18810.1 hypothetical protein [Acinetobacter haemolyticus]NAR30647.1 hypothetical protein [Acinetobacter haemolyticus]NAR36597.1 hypothetical protein [Acinetobacter haemolyticus]NAR47663.1 hypothetical protein [Acinetobacter haemolyticus]NAR64238.1 hypothetical protein [Acinetobacter haemolyticus]
MIDTQQRHKHPHLLLNIVIIVLETFFSFILTHDAGLRLQAKKLIDDKITIRINSYIPFFDFYIQFTEKGLLFDMKALDRKIDLEINCTLIDLIKIFVLNNQKSISNLRILGDSTLAEQFTDLIPHFTLSSILVNWRQWFNAFDDDADTIASQHRIPPLLEKIDQQRSEINTLLVEVKQYQNRIHRLQKRQRMINIAFVTLSFILVAIFVYNMWIQ